MLGRIGSWWGRASTARRIVTVVAVLVVVAVVAVGAVVVVLLRPAASIDDYARYERNDTDALADDQVSITFFGVSTLLFDDGDTQLLVDAFFTRPTKSEYLSTMQSDTTAVQRFITDFRMDRVQGVVVAHSHVDHAIDVASVALDTGATVWGTESTLNIARGGGVDEAQLQLATDGTVAEVGDFSVRFVETPHSVVPGTEEPATPPTIGEPLEQPATNEQFAEGGNFSFVITHGTHVYVVVPSANHRTGALAGVDADVLLLGTALLGMQDVGFRTTYLDETIGATTPEVVVPLHWDDFLRPWVPGEARFNPRLIDAEPTAGFDAVIDRTRSAGARFVVLQAGSRLVVPG